GARGSGGKALLKRGDRVRVEGPTAAEGDYGLVSVVHRYDHTNGSRNEFTATPWMDYTHAEQPQPNRMSGVVSARVVEHADPRGMGRIQIKKDWMNEERSNWARSTTPSARGRRRFVFY